MAKTPSVLDHYPDYQVDIGIEVHVQLITNSKIFCSSSNCVGKQPNSNICPVCAGYPGVLPVLNQKVLDHAIATGLATNCTITPVSEFARKHYFYPDLPKNYQITQSDLPICQNGYVAIRLEDGSIKNVRLIRIHMEEDAGKNIHAGASNESFVDLNRAGTPLLEIVTHPDINSAYEAKAYLRALRAIVQYLGVCSGNMEEGAFRADTNISVRKKGSTKLGTRCELKNINSFKFIGDAIEYEIERQISLLEEGGHIRQETRLWDTKERKTTLMRSKEESADYRYFQDPDLPLIVIEEAYISRIRATLPELPEQKFERLRTEGLSDYEAEILVFDPELAQYYEQARKHTASKQLINWVLRDVTAYVNEQKLTFATCPVTPEKLAQLIELIEKGTINNQAAKEVFVLIAQTGKDAAIIVKEQGLEQIGSTDELEAIIKEVLAANAESVAQYKAGTQKLFGFFMGEAMKKSKGKGNPKILQELLKKHLG